MSHDTALCEMILSCQLLVGNWSDLHANGLHLFNDVGVSGAITPGGCAQIFVVCFFFYLFSPYDERKQDVCFGRISHAVYCK